MAEKLLTFLCSIALPSSIVIVGEKNLDCISSAHSHTSHTSVIIGQVNLGRKYNWLAVKQN